MFPANPSGQTCFCAIENASTIERSNNDLAFDTIDSIRRSAPANYVRIEDQNELFDLNGDDDVASLLIITVEPHQFMICCDGEHHKVHTNRHCPKYHPIRFGSGNTEQDPTRSLTPRVDVLNISSLVVDLERYFLWFGHIETVYVLGTTVAVFRMKPYAVEHILRSPIHEVSISRPSVLIEPSESNLAISDHLISIQFTANKLGIRG